MPEEGFHPSRRLKKRGNEYLADLNLWPFVGVVLVLLMIFMIITGPPFAHGHIVPNDVAAVRHAVPLPLAIRDDAMRITVTRDGTVYFRNAHVSLANILERIRESVKDGAERRAYLSVDSRARYGDVKVVLDEIRSAGIEKVTFLVEKKRD